MRKPSEFESHPTSFEEARSEGNYRAVCKHVVDGDTFDVFVDLGLGKYAYETIRLTSSSGILDTPEINKGTPEERERGLVARARVVELIEGKPVAIRTYRDTQTFGRYVAECYYLAGENEPAWIDLAETLRAEGLLK